jgi:putative glutamine amidotransferase
MDGKIIEAVRHSRFSHVYGVQFHPEKPGLYDPSIRHAFSCSDSIQFHEVIAGTESLDFHLDYWKRLGKVLQSIRSQ